jgi:hypothetical protein
MVEIFRYVGIGHEEEFGTPVEGALFFDPASGTLDTPAGYENEVSGGMGRMNRRKMPGFYSPTGNVTLDVDINTLSYFLRGALDGYVFTSGGGAPAHNKHEFYGGNDNVLESWTMRLGKDVFEHVFQGCMINTFKLSVADKLASASVDILAQKDSKATLKTYSDIQSYIPEAYPLAFYNITAEVNGAGVSADVRSVDLTISNNLGRDSGRSIGSMYPATFKCGQRSVDVVMQMQFDDLTYLELFWGGETGPACTGSTQFPILLDYDNDEYGELGVSLPNCRLVSAPIQPRGKDTVYQTITCRAMLAEDVVLAYASTVDTDILCTLLNSETTLA